MMGDLRAAVKIEFRMCGHEAKQSWSINWFDSGYGYQMDKRILEWFDEQVTKAMNKYREDLTKAIAEMKTSENEKIERKLLAELKAKYENS